ncbi:MAG: right-handed parallel beta-helix repeat-containing protein [Deltaproteobacteria bacterium]|nr:right-handed parallel beta-helix repeat-containing protein [Deltaproteobacteria bacterium]
MTSIVRSYHVGPRLASQRPSSNVSSDAVQYYVATNGNDSWTGLLLSPNADRSDGPFATLEGARDRIRELRAAGEISPPIIVNIRSGTYVLSRTLELESQDSGEEDRSVVWRAYLAPGQKNGAAIISGGRRITAEWGPVRGRLGDPIDIDFGTRPIYMTEIAPLEDGQPWRFNSLFVEGERATRARSPNIGDSFPYFTMADDVVYGDPRVSCDVRRRANLELSPDCQDMLPIPNEAYSSFLFQWRDIQAIWSGLGNVEVVALKAWEQTRQCLSHVEGNRAYLQADIDKPYQYTGFSGRYYVENLRGALDSPGEWFLDSRNSRLYYWPLPGQDMGRAEVIVPTLTQLVRFHPDAHDIVFQRLTFAHTDWGLSDGGHIGCQAAVCLATPPTIEFEVSGPPFDDREANGAERIQILDNILKHTGSYAVGGPTRRSVFRGNAIYDTGGGGIQIGGIDDRAIDSVGWPLGHADTQFLSEQNEITDNTIHDIGKVYLESVGIQDLLSRETKISHNLIYDAPYSGISVGWIWNARTTRAGNNQIENNEVHHVCQILTDCGGIYTLGHQTGSFIRRNLIHDIPFTSHHLHKTSLMGIYLDQGSNGFTVSENIVYRIASAALHIHQGSFNTIENNIFVDGSSAEELMNDYGQIGFSTPEPSTCPYDSGLSSRKGLYLHPETGGCPETARGRAPPQGNVFQHNIIYGSPPENDRKLIHYDRWPYPFVSSNHNLFFWPRMRSRLLPGNLWEWQREMRQDLNSISADPLFQDPVRQNFNLRPGSPASRIDFIPFTLTQ